MAGVEVGTAYVSVLPSTKGFHKALAGEVEQSATAAGTTAGQGFSGGFGKALKGVGVAMAATFSAGAVISAAQQSITAASNLAESQAKVDVVFRGSADAMNTWAETASTSMLMSSQAALEAAGTYGNLFSAFGIGQTESAAMSKSLVELASDLASFNNTPVDDALLALRSGLSGETEPLKRFGIALTEQRLKQEALTLGIYDGKGALDAAQKAQASYALIMRDSALAQGDVERTADGYANTMRAVTAEIENQKAIIGTEMLRAIQDSSAAMGGAGGLVEMTKSLGDVAADTTAAIGWLTSAVVGFGDALPEIVDDENALWTILKNFPAALPGRAVLAIGDAQRESAAAARDMTFEQRLLNQALNQTPYEADEASDSVSEYDKYLMEMTDRTIKASTGVDTLAAALDRFAGRSNLRQSSLSIRESWAALDTMGERVTVGKGAKAHTVQKPFDPDVNGGRFANTESGRQAEAWALGVAQQYLDRASQQSAAGNDQAALNTLQRGQARVGAQFGEWGVDRPRGYANSMIPIPQWLRSEIASDRMPPASDVSDESRRVGNGGTTNNYNFTGDIVVPNAREAARRAAELARLRGLASGSQIPAEAS